MEAANKVEEKIVVDASKDAAMVTAEPKAEKLIVENKENIKEPSPQTSEVKETVEPKVVAADKTDKKQDAQVVRAKVREPVSTEKVADVSKTTAPVRPQRGRKSSAEQPAPSQPQTAPVRPRRASTETQATQPTPTPRPTVSQEPVCTTSEHTVPTTTQVQEPPKVTPVPQAKEKVVPIATTQEQAPSKPQTKSEVSTRPKSIQSQTSTTQRRNSKEVKAPQRGSSVTQSAARPTRQGSQDVPSQGSRRSSGESQAPKEASENQPVRRGSSEASQRRGSGEGQRRGSGEGQSTRRDSGETSRKGSSDSPTSPAALGQVVTRLTGLLGEQWAQLGSGSGAQQQQTPSQQEAPTAPKQAAGKKVEPGKGTGAKPASKATPAAPAGKPAGKPASSKMSSIQSQLVSSLSVLSAFYSPGQKAAAASKQQDQAGLKSIMKKNGVADKQGSKGAKKNLKFVGVNGGYETTSSEESSGDEKSKVEVEEDSSEPEVEKEKEPEPTEKSQETTESPQKEPERAAEAAEAEETPKAEASASVVKEESERGLLDTTPEHEVLEEDGEKVDRGFVDACLYVKDRMEEVSSPDKEMRQVLVVLYQEWFRVSSQKESRADTVRLYLRQVGLTTPTLLPYVVNLTDGNGNMALHYSVSHSNFSVVKLLLDTGLCETDNVNKAGYTPVMLAALTAAESPDDLEVAEQLLKMGDVNARSRQAGQTALMLAVSHGRVAMVKLLLSCGADVNAQDREGSTALMCACEHGHTHITRLLLETQQCDMSLTDKNGQTALAVAEGASHQDIVDLLKSYEKSPPDLL